MATKTKSRVAEAVDFVPWNDHQRSAILAECQQILSHHFFNKSERCTALFRYLVDRTLARDHDALKERCLGIEVFGRSPTYDTNADPVVRMTAGEIRKRLAQFYEERDEISHIRVHLFPGSYLLHFELPTEESVAQPTEINSLTALEKEGAGTEENLLPTTIARPRLRRWLLVVCASIVILLAIIAIRTLVMPRFRSTQALIWAPIVQGHGTVSVYVNNDEIGGLNSLAAGFNWAAEDAGIIASHQVPRGAFPLGPRPAVSFVDALTAARIVAILSTRHERATMLGISNVTLKDLRSGPDVLVGGFDNPWALALLSGLRFRLRVDPVTQVEWIEDSERPGGREWEESGGSSMKFSTSTSDYALITRFHSPVTGTWILAIEGLGLQGTGAGGALLTDPTLDNILPTSLRNTTKNFQVVVGVTVMNGFTSPPRILATYVW